MFSASALTEALLSPWLGPALLQDADCFRWTPTSRVGVTAVVLGPQGPAGASGQGPSAPSPTAAPTSLALLPLSPEHWLVGSSCQPGPRVRERLTRGWAPRLPASPGLKSLKPGPRSRQHPTSTIWLLPSRGLCRFPRGQSPAQAATRSELHEDRHGQENAPEEPRGSEPRAQPWTAARPVLL